MNETILQKDIEKRIRQEFLARDYARPLMESYTITSEDFSVPVGNDLIYLCTPSLEVPFYARVVFISSDNYLSTSKREYDKMLLKNLISFRDYLKIRTYNLVPFVPFRLDFLRIIPEY